MNTIKILNDFTDSIYTELMKALYGIKVQCNVPDRRTAVLKYNLIPFWDNEYDCGLTSISTTYPSCELNFPLGVVGDGVGNLYIADVYNYRIRKINQYGIITTYAGTGTSGNSGDGGQAINAQFSLGASIALDYSGNLYISDVNNHCIRRIDSATGIVTTIAGINGSHGFSGDTGLATAAKLFNPTCICFDTLGNLFIADSGNYRIRKVDTHGIITTIAGTGTNGDTGDTGPATAANINLLGLTVDYNGNIYFSSNTYNRIRVIGFDGNINTYAGTGTAGYTGDGGLATSATLNSPAGLYTDNAGNLFIGDLANFCIRRVDVNTKVITTVTGNGVSGYTGDNGLASLATISYPALFWIDGYGNLYLTDSQNNAIRRIDSCGTITTIAGNGIAGFTGDGGPASAFRTNGILITSPVIAGSSNPDPCKPNQPVGICYPHNNLNYPRQCGCCH